MTIQSTTNDHLVSDEAAPIGPDGRRARVLAHVNEVGEASVEALSRLVDASRETIRRDLAALDAAGLIRKFHGGGRMAAQGPRGEGPFGQRMTENVAAKRAIAQRAAALFDEGQSLFIDAGSTTIFFAEALAARSGLTVITNASSIATIIARSGRHKVFALGGAFHEATSSCLGSMTIAQARQFNPDHAVLTVGSISEAGVADHDADEAELARTMVALARQVTVLADHSKFIKSGLFPVASIDRIARVVTDKDPPAHLAVIMRKHGVEICI